MTDTCNIKRKFLCPTAAVIIRILIWLKERVLEAQSEPEKERMREGKREQENEFLHVNIF